MKKSKVLAKLNPKFLDGIAHRGLWNDKYTENGINAFKNAIDHDVAFEFDIHLTKDNQLVVCHDENLKRTTGKNGIIEHLTLKEIKDNYRLLDGGDIPTLQEVFDLNNEQVPVVIELKVYKKNYKPLAKKAMEMFAQIKDKRNAMIISFDPRSLWPLRKSGFIRSLLVAKSDEYTWKFRHTVESVDVDKQMFTQKRVQKYHKHYFVNCWTIESNEDIETVLPYVDTMTFQHLDVALIKEKLNKN